MKLKNIFILSLLLLTLACEKELTSDHQEQMMSTIAHSETYKNYRLALHKNVLSESSGAYNRKEAIAYINRHYPNSKSLCNEDFSVAPIKGIELMIDGICDIGLSLDRLNQEFPSFQSFTNAEKVQVGHIYSSEVKRDRSKDFELLPN